MKLPSFFRYFPLVCLCISATLGWSADTGYKQPPDALSSLVDVERLPSVSMSYDRTMTLLYKAASLPGIDEVSREEMRLANMRFNPANRGPSRSFANESVQLLMIESGETRSFEGLPKNKVHGGQWSPDSKHVAFTVEEADGIHLWLASVSEMKAWRVGNFSLNATLGRNPFEWLSDSKTLLAMTVPDNMGEAPKKSNVPAGPNIQETTGKKAVVRTFQDLLSSAHDEALFDHYISSEIRLVELDGTSRVISKKGIHRDINSSPDGNYIMITRIKRPYSYLVPYFRFPTEFEVVDRNGKRVHLVADIPLQENIPKGFSSVRVGPRNIAWKSNAPATLTWVEAQDGGDPANEVEVRDRLYMQAAPFTEAPIEIAHTGSRLSDVSWGDGFGLVSEVWWKSRALKTWVINPDKPGEKKLLFDRSVEDKYSDPGSPLFWANEWGFYELLTNSEGNLIFTGSGASPKGNIPFMETRNLETGEVKRLWQSEAPYYEQVMIILDKDAKRFITRRESNDEPPNLYLRTVEAVEKPLTHMKHPTPHLAGVTKEIITYERNDGVKLSGKLYLPAGYKPEDGPLPTLLWAYPREFKSAEAAGQLSDSPYRFASISFWGALPYLAMGYAVLDGPTMPIVGEGEMEPNDSFRKQLVASAQAAVDEVVRRGVTDPERVAIGGHSYGAFMVANLLAHSDIFAAGIARSGAYNRTLTPFGFQSEERTFWEAQNIYASMSPFFHAEKIDEPILFIHGEADNNSGTFPLQSQRMFHAVKGLGGTAKLVMLPHESHGYRARESILHMLYEQLEWLNKYVKDKAPKTEKSPS